LTSDDWDLIRIKAGNEEFPAFFVFLFVDDVGAGPVAGEKMRGGNNPVVENPYGITPL